jgi:hypothetical protein
MTAICSPVLFKYTNVFIGTGVSDARVRVEPEMDPMTSNTGCGFVAGSCEFETVYVPGPPEAVIVRLGTVCEMLTV